MATSSAPRPNLNGIDRCAICNRLLIGSIYMLIDRPERYCETCINTRPRCGCCGAPLGEHFWKLHDERLQCPICHSTAIYDYATCRRIYDETVAALIKQMGLTLNVGVELRLVDAPTLWAIRSQSRKEPEYPILLGLYMRRGHQRAIYMLYGLPLLLFRITIAHEYAHAWQGEHCPLLKSEELREGFAEWVAYRHLLWLGCTKAAARMRYPQNPYHLMLEKTLSLEQQLGVHGLLNYIRRAE